MNKYSTQKTGYIVGLFMILAIILLLLISNYQRGNNPPTATVVSQATKNTDQPDSPIPSHTPTQTIAQDTNIPPLSTPTVITRPVNTQEADSSKITPTLLNPPIASTPMPSSTAISIVPITQSIIIATQTPSALPTPPLPRPTSTPTPTFEPLSNQPIGGYVFSPPELFLTHNYVEIVDWLPESPEELIIRNFEDDKFLVEILNVKTGQRQRVVETSNYIVGKPVWLPATQQMAYLAQDESGTTNLYLDGISPQNVNAVAVSHVSPPLVSDDTGGGVLVFDTQMQLLSTNKDAGAIQGMSMGEALPAIEGGPFPHYQSAWSDQTDWIAYYHPVKFLLVNSKTGKTQEVDLGKAAGDWGRWGAVYTTWSPDGDKLAVIVAPADYAISDPPPFTKLIIYIPDTGDIRLIEGDFTFVTNVVWTPDNKHVLISGIIGQNEEGLNVTAVFLVNVATQQITPIPIIPDDAFGLISFKSLAWSPDGEYIVIGYTENPFEGRWYRVLVRSAK